MPSDRRDRRALGVGNLALTALAAAAVLAYGYSRMSRPVPEAGRVSGGPGPAEFGLLDGRGGTHPPDLHGSDPEGRRRRRTASGHRPVERVEPGRAAMRSSSGSTPATPPPIPWSPFSGKPGRWFLLGAPVIRGLGNLFFHELSDPDRPGRVPGGSLRQDPAGPFRGGRSFLGIRVVPDLHGQGRGSGRGGLDHRVGAGHCSNCPSRPAAPSASPPPSASRTPSPGLCRDFAREGADFFVNLTNDSWSRTVSALVQHFAAARFRAVENRRTLVRSTNGGISCVVGPFGEVLAELPVFRAESRFLEIPVYREDRQTVYTTYGDWFAYSALFLSGLFALILVLEERISTRRNSREHP
ncbi:MAG: hypothetical protein MZU97_07995 [Bacillus subtilis]|nr:hypothetical protein [Bacillus subtilis]